MKFLNGFKIFSFTFFAILFIIFTSAFSFLFMDEYRRKNIGKRERTMAEKKKLGNKLAAVLVAACCCAFVVALIYTLNVAETS